MASFTFLQSEEGTGSGDFGGVGSGNSVDEYQSTIELALEAEAEANLGEFIASENTSSSRRSSHSVQDPLLSRHSLRTESAESKGEGRKSQKIYIITEDLTIVIAGFVTNPLREVL